MCLYNFCVKNINCVFNAPKWRLFTLLIFTVVVLNSPLRSQTYPPVIVGAERIEQYLPFLEGKQVGFVVNQTSRVGACHLIDTLNNRGVCVARIFAPEHGFRGNADAGENIGETFDDRTGAVVASIYGKKRKPTKEDLEGLDVVVFDIQDVGARFYTYISTLFYVMEACAEAGIVVVVLDRPNPNGHLVDGPVLDTRYTSFVGIAPLPIAHGCTVGELAQLFKGECWINQGYDLNLTVVACENYTHHTPYDLPIKPSPNLPTMRSVLLYPSLCLFEGSTCSVGRGTEWPFEVVGHPDFGLDSFCFTPVPNNGNKHPIFQESICYGWDFHQLSIDSLRNSNQLNISWLLDFYRSFPNKSVFFRRDNFLDLLSGSNKLRQQVQAGMSEAEIRATWSEDLAVFLSIRKRYLLYE